MPKLLRELLTRPSAAADCHPLENPWPQEGRFGQGPQQQLRARRSKPCGYRPGTRAAERWDLNTPAAPRRPPYSLPRPKILVPGGTEHTSQTFPPTTEPLPITVSPPRMVAPA